MSEMFKKRLAIMLSILFVLPTIIGILPMAQLETQAAGYESVVWETYIDTLQVEAEQGFYVGDYATYYKSNGKYATRTSLSLVKAKYKSSDKTVATVDSKGYMKTLKPGKTTITITYKGKKLTKEFEVVKKGTFATSDAITALKSAAAELPKKLSATVNNKRGFVLLKSQKTYLDAVEKYEEAIDKKGFLIEKVTYASGYSYTSTTNKLAVPQAGRYLVLKNILDSYAQKNNPTSTRSSKVLKIASASASAKKNQITLKFNKKVTNEQVLAAKIFYENAYNKNESLKELPDKQAYIQISGIEDTKTHKYYSGVMTIRQGSKEATIQLYESKYVDGKNTYKRIKVKKNTTYKLGYAEDWMKGKKVKAK